MSIVRLLLAVGCVSLGMTVAEARAQAPHDPQVEAFLRQVFRRMDRNKNGALSVRELGRGLSRAQRRHVLRTLDQDGNGRVSWAEYHLAGQAYAARIQAEARAALARAPIAGAHDESPAERAERERAERAERERESAERERAEERREAWLWLRGRSK